ncbi:MAG: hypothetical protein ABIL16_08390 [candidate division WOR-3 bacterium]
MKRLIIVFFLISCKNIGYLTYDYINFGEDYEVDMLGDGKYYTKFKAYHSEGNYYWEIAGERMVMERDGEWIKADGIPLFIYPLSETSWQLEGYNTTSSGREIREGDCFIVESRITRDSNNIYSIRHYTFKFCKYGISSIALGGDSLFIKDSLVSFIDKRTFVRIDDR